MHRSLTLARAGKNRWEGTDRSNPEFLVASLAVLDAGFVWKSTALADSSSGSVAAKAKAALATVG